MKSLQEKHLQAKEQPHFYQDHIHEWYAQLQNHKTNSVWHLYENKDVVYALAKQLDNVPIAERKPLFGLTMGVKDLFHIVDYKTTAGSRILETMKSPITSTVVQDLQSSHALPLAKVSMDEFAMGSFTNTAYLGKTTHIHTDYTAGGSSGGSAISLKEQLFDFTIGSDTGGSVRQPAAFCNVVAYKPSYGGLSRYGMLPYASSLDQAGLFTHDIVDLQYLMESMDIAMTHAYIKDDNDDTHIGLKRQVIHKSNLVGAYFPFFLQSNDIKDEIKYLYQKELDTLKEKGVILMPIDLPATSMMFHTASIYYTISCAEAASNLAKYQGVYYGVPLSDFVVQMEREGRSIKSYQEAIALYRSRHLGNDVKARIVMGNELLSSENFHTVFEKAQLMRQHLKMEINNMLNNVDFLVLPTFPSLTPKWSEIELMSQEEVFMSDFLSDFLTVAFSLTGHPVVVMPSSHEVVHSDRSIKNTGFQYVGKAFYDRQLINDCVWIGATK